MLRNVIIAIGLIVALVPYLGFPQSIDTIILTTLGLTLVVLTLLARRKLKRQRGEDRTLVSEASPKVLHVERTEVTDTPTVHIERVVTVDQATEVAQSGEETIVEEKKTVVKRRKRKPKAEPAVIEDSTPVMETAHEEAS